MFSKTEDGSPNAEDRKIFTAILHSLYAVNRLGAYALFNGIVKNKYGLCQWSEKLPTDS